MIESGASFEPRLEETKRVGRVLGIVQLIHSQPRMWSRIRLAQRFERSERMIDKDLELIRHALRFDLCHTREGYYFVGGPLLKLVGLTVPEALALVLAAQQARDTGTVEASIVASALARLEEALPRDIVPYLRRAAGDGGRPPFGPQGERGRTLALLEQALLERRRALVEYSSASRGDATTERLVAPYHLMPYERSWLVIADDSLRRQVRMFKVDRIRRCELTAEHYTIPADFDVTAYLGSTWGVLRGAGGAVTHVVLQFSAKAAAWVRDERWHSSQETEGLSDGGLVMRFSCGVTHELVRWVLSFGGEVRVVEPAELERAIHDEAARVLQRDFGAGDADSDVVPEQG